MTDPGEGLINLMTKEHGVIYSGGGYRNRSLEDGNVEAGFANTFGYQFTTEDLIDKTAPLAIVLEVISESYHSTANYRTILQAPIVGSTNPLLVWYHKRTTFSGDIAWVQRGASTYTQYSDMSGLTDLTPLNQRHWIVISYNGSGWDTSANWACYVNGRTLSVSRILGSISTASNIILVGSTPTGAEWDGGIRQVRVYDREWSHAEAFRFWNPATRDDLFKPPRKYYTLGYAPQGGGIIHSPLRSKIIRAAEWQ